MGVIGEASHAALPTRLRLIDVQLARGELSLADILNPKAPLASETIRAEYQQRLPSLLAAFPLTRLTNQFVDFLVNWRATKEQKLYNQRIQVRSDWLLGQSLVPFYEADGYVFEQLTARAFRQQGWSVEETRKSNDGGVDLRLRNGRVLILVQCKAHSKPIAPSALRDLYGAMHHENAAGGILVTRSGVSNLARQWIQGKDILVLTPELLLKGPAVSRSR